MGTIKKLIFLFFLFPFTVCAATYYISSSGNDSTGDGSTGNPWKTPTKAIGEMSGGDTLIFKNGTYTGSDYYIPDPPSGSAEAYTYIRAETNFSVIINGNWAAGTPLGWQGVSYIEVEGLIIKNVGRAMQLDNVDYCKFKNIAIKNGTNYNSEYANCIVLGEEYSAGASTYNLFQDIFIVGNMRYGLMFARADHNIARRVVIRYDGNTGQQPIACFCNYGDIGSYGGGNDNIYQNCISIDSNTSYIESSYANQHGSEGNKYYGCISLKSKHVHLSEDMGSGDSGNDWINGVSWDCFGGSQYGHGMAMNTGYNNLIDQSTIGYADAYQVINWDGGGTKTLKNSYVIVSDGNADYTDGVTQTYNTYYGGGAAPAGTGNTVADPDLDYIVLSKDEGTGESSARRGAYIWYKRGIDDTLYGDSGYNTLTANVVWPWPNEATWHSIAAEADSASNCTPGNDTDRGFAASGVTLTNYIWGYTYGNQPPDFGGSSPSIQTASLANGTEEETYSQTVIATGGTTPYVWTVSVGSLPDGLSLNSGTGAITGTPTEAAVGDNTFTILCTDDVSATDTQEYTITIQAAVGEPPAEGSIVGGTLAGASTK